MAQKRAAGKPEERRRGGARQNPEGQLKKRVETRNTPGPRAQWKPGNMIYPVPAVLVTVETDAGPLTLIRYQGAEGLCLAVTFDPQAFPVTRCGLAAGAGVGFVDSLPAPDGREMRIAFGQAQ